jgi:Fe-S cluster assembly protein SufD
LESGIEMQSESVTVTDADAEAEIQADSKAGTLHFRKLTARLNRNSHVLAVSAHTGSRLMRHSFSIDLLGEGADAEVNGAVVLTGRRQSHNYLRIRHLVPNCTSRQHFKSVVAGSSRSSVDGTIFVAQDAQGTNANQLINNLMLSDEAHTDSKPQLMIHADDVKCTHGTTIGKLDPAQQFYLESRGLTFAQARTLMTVAFIAEILNKTGAANSASAPGGQVDNGATASFRTQLDHELLDSLKLHLPSVSGESSINHA